MKIKKIEEFVFEIPKSGRMNVPARVFLSDELISSVDEGSLEQLANIASLPGIQKYPVGLPDIHYGYGAPIGSVAAFDVNEGGVSPGMCGFDINCGVRLLKTNMHLSDAKPKLKKFVDEIFKNVPSGVGKKSNVKFSKSEFTKVLEEGAKAIVDRYGYENDLLHIEEGGFMETDARSVSEKAIKRGIHQLGTLGAGNHFVEVQVVDKIFDEKTAKKFGLFEGEIVVMIHTGSRGFGHQVATDFVKLLNEKYREISKSIPDPELIYAPSGSKEEEDYFNAMKAASNFAWANREMISHQVRKAFKKVYGSDSMPLLYDLAHNIIKKRKHFVGGKKKEVYVHRKGATRAFGPNEPEVPSDYKSVGQPVLLPGSMGTSSYVMVGTEAAMKKTFGSIAHGAGRLLSRSKATSEFTDNQIIKELSELGVYARSASKGVLSEEAPKAYKDVSEVVRVCEGSGIAKAVAKLRPLGVVKG